MNNLTDQQIKELREAFGIEDETTDIDKTILTCSKGSYEAENNTDKCEKDYSMLEKKYKELMAKYGK